MRRVFAVSLLALVVACQDLSQPTAPPPEALLSLTPANAPQMPETVMPGEVVVRVRDGFEPGAVASAYGLSVAGRGYADAFVVLRGAAGNERALAARLGADTRIEWAEPNYLRQPTAVDSHLWAFYNPGGLFVRFTKGGSKGQPVSSYLSVLDADEDNIDNSYGAGGAPVVIGSIDTGVRMDHPEFLPGQLIAGNDWYSNDSNPSDENDHGTHTTGTMVGRTVGIAGVSGAGPNVQVYVQRVCGPRGCPLSAIASAIRAAADVPGMVAVNLSLGGSTESKGEKDAIEYAHGKNVLVIASAGNGGTNKIGCPACDPLAISVAASNWQDELSYYSNWGTGLDLTAPGGELYSNTSSESGIYSAVRNGYKYFQGTSMAAPQVTGTAGVVASKTGLRGVALRARLEGTTDNLGAPGYDTTFGNGRLNSYRAVTGGSLAGGS